MANNKRWHFLSFEDLEAKYNDGYFDCDDVAEFTDPIVLDWCARLDDWAPKVALCFNRHSSAVTLDRISQHEMPELRRLVCYHRSCSTETMERLLDDGDKFVRDAALECLEKRGVGPTWRKQRRVKVRR
ncbi:MAG TPA: hypothetical protein VMY05_11145 [Acidobacteriota bacterium]|nr:hypothetical protein [Acidobacteriota bacterium]